MNLFFLDRLLGNCCGVKSAGSATGFSEPPGGRRVHVASREWTMPIFSYFAVVGSVMVALLFAADATLTKSTTPVVATSSLYGMPKPWHPDPTQTLAATPAPAPDMSSEAVLAAAPKTEPVNQRTAVAEAPPKKKRVVARRTQPVDARPNYYAASRGGDPFTQNYAWSRNSDPFSGGGMFGRF
jgi:hypothetical protein